MTEAQAGRSRNTWCDAATTNDGVRANVLTDMAVADG
jgi:hypothetical protein